MAAAKNPPAEPNVDREIVSTRVFAASRQQLFDAFRDPLQLTRWWGPHGFTSTFQTFEVRPGGEGRFVLRGPDGTAYPNHVTFSEVTPPDRIVFRHHDPVHGFVMTIVHTNHGNRTHVMWRQLFDSAAECAKVRDFISVANQQNFDRLEAHLATLPPNLT